MPIRANKAMNTPIVLTRPTNLLPLFKPGPPKQRQQQQQQQKQTTMATNGPKDEAAPTFASIGIKNTLIRSAPGVHLTAHQKVLVGSVLDLFEASPTLRHLSLWSPDATFADPLTEARGRERYAAQWYGLAALFWPAAIQRHEVLSAGNPIEVAVSNRYVVRGLRTAHLIDSLVRIHVGDDSKITRVEDRWDDKELPDGSVKEAFRKLNAATVPMVVKVPKDEKEDMEMKAEREARSS
ncbi:hypothetical protein F4775DRAFT_591386 [Biscogniauxia sp. FL1348]|nr:hypothetical protein F4775DRAFT_591386 [Biscogniauxia sp. FL1348]